VQAIQVGGASSAYFTTAQGRDITLDPDEMVTRGSILGAGVVKVLGPERCLLDEAIQLAEFFARECCGQCPPCRMETTSLLGMLHQLEAGKARANVLESITELLMFAADKGKCGFIRMPRSPFSSLFTNFKADFDAHLGGEACPAATR
jgi:NADH:ubiquinone oxidoreductase subunit F (NADH-binding)